MKIDSKKSHFRALLSRHAAALGYVFGVILPLILKTGRRPVIFDKFGGMGDIICTFPAALELKKRHPHAEFIYNCQKDFACLPKMGGVTNRITTFRDVGLIGYWYRFLLAGFYNFASDDDKPESAPKDVYIKDFGRLFGIALEDSHPRLQIDPALLSKVKDLLRGYDLPSGPLIILHPGPSWPVREWPLENWKQLVAELRQQGFNNIVRLGVGRYSIFGQVEVETIPGALSLVDQLSLEESIALISMAELFIGIDSGLLHIAGALRIPSVGLWGPTSPHLRFADTAGQTFVIGRVECQGCQHRFPRLHWITGCPYDIKCMKSIRVEEVLQAGLKRMESTAPTDA